MIGPYGSSPGYEAHLIAMSQWCSVSFKPVVWSPKRVHACDLPWWRKFRWDVAGAFLAPFLSVSWGTHSHLLREVFLMILAGVPLEREIGTLFLSLKECRCFCPSFFSLLFCTESFPEFGAGLLISEFWGFLCWFSSSPGLWAALWAGTHCDKVWGALGRSGRSLQRFQLLVVTMYPMFHQKVTPLQEASRLPGNATWTCGCHCQPVEQPWS